MKLVPLVVLMLLLSGCESVGEMSPADVFWGEPVRAITLPDGRAGFLVQCERGPEHCMERARAACGGNFSILHRTESADTANRSVEIACST